MSTQRKMDRWSCPCCKKHLGGNAVLTVSDRSVAAHALRVAADRFEEDAKTARAAGPNHAGLAEQFDKQARESRELADGIEL